MGVRGVGGEEREGGRNFPQDFGNRDTRVILLRYESLLGTLMLSSQIRLKRVI